MSEEHLFYRAYGLQICSELVCPELTPEAPGTPDVFIRYGTVPENLPDTTVKGVRYQASPEQFLLQVDHVANYLVSGGREILIKRAPETDEDSIRLFLLGSALGALLHQRELLPLHGSAVQVDDGVCVFVGLSGNGKSTTAAAFRQRGYRVLADDVCVVSIRDDGIPQVVPGYPQLKLWADTLQKLDQSAEDLRQVRPQLEKYALQLHDDFCQTPLPLRRLYVLMTSNGEEFRLTPVKGMQKLPVLIHNTYRQRLVKGLGMKIPHFQQCAAAAKQIKIVRIMRPSWPFLLDELLDLLEKDFFDERSDSQ